MRKNQINKGFFVGCLLVDWYLFNKKTPTVIADSGRWQENTKKRRLYFCSPESQNVNACIELPQSGLAVPALDQPGVSVLGQCLPADAEDGTRLAYAVAAVGRNLWFVTRNHSDAAFWRNSFSSSFALMSARW